jgi:ATP-dependent DNA helicase RecQ
MIINPDELLPGLLQSHFGYHHFRPLQKEIMTRALSRKDSLVLMPTGGGKSLCYQLPALCLDGVTLVVSPLISLMKDQVDALRANDIPAGFISSALTAAEISQVQAQAGKGEIKLLYLAPERFGLPGFRNFLGTINVSLIAIDEAHCISEWGHEFRPDYRNLRLLRGDFPEVPIMALTATATQRVREDIIQQLGLHQGQVYVSSFNRPNLNYQVRPKRDAFNSLVSLLQKHQNEPAIIYRFSRKDTEELAADLSQCGLKALPYHAGLSNAMRDAHQEAFVRDEAPIIVATIAFGMGIDKPDVRLVVHYDLPKSLEGYYQETGRAGRDGLPSECVLFYSYGDRARHDYFISQSTSATERENAQLKLAQMVEFCQLQSCRRRFLLEYFGEQPEEDCCDGCDVCLAPREEFDATEIAQKILSTVIRTGERFGMGHISSVLRGRKTQRLLDQGHDKLSVYGLARDISDADLKDLVGLLLARGLLAKSGSEYPTLAVTPAGRDFLRRRERLTLERRTPDQEVETATRSTTLDYDRALFEHLRALRKRMADARGVPPFVVFGDATLHQMAAYYPQSNDSLSRISGVGAAKLRQFGDAFVAEIGRYAKENQLAERSIPSPRRQRDRQQEPKPRRVTSTMQETRELFSQQLSIPEIAARRGLSSGTILNHLERLVMAGEELELDYLLPPPERIDKIREAFHQAGDEYLAPARELLGEGFSYDEIRLVRLYLHQMSGA